MRTIALFNVIIYLLMALQYAHGAVHNIKIGYSDTLEITKEAYNLLCYGFEADHPSNHCTSEYIDSEMIWDALMANDVQAALMSEEIILANQKRAKQPIIVLPFYQQYMLLIGNNDLTLENIQSFRDKTIGVTDWSSKEHRAKPLGLALGLKEHDVFFHISSTREQLTDLFCGFALDGIMIMSNPSSTLARELITSCDGKIQSFTDQQIQKIQKSSLGFYPAIIPKETFWRVEEDVKTLRSRTFLVINPNKDVSRSILNSLDHVKDELNLITLRTDITPKSIIDTYDINPIKLHPLGQSLIDQLRQDLNDSLPQSVGVSESEIQDSQHSL